eukprot:m.82663 g.82663  ORF g.82663 m.82663 type:complete len:510 (-) comp8272_c0_seq1:261-1790(-)
MSASSSDDSAAATWEIELDSIVHKGPRSNKVQPEPSACDESAPAPRGISMSTYQLVRMAAVWFGTSCTSDFLFFEGIPSQMRSTVGDENKEWGLSTVVLTSAVITLALGPMVGSFSDRSTISMGRRRPFIMVGAIFIAVFTFLMGLSNKVLPPEPVRQQDVNCTALPEGVEEMTEAPPFETHGNFLLYIVLNLMVSLGFVLVEVPFNGLVADKVPAHQRGTASSYIGVMAIAGGIAGMVFGLFYRELGVMIAFGSVSVVFLCTVSLGCTVSEDRPKIDLASAHASGLEMFRSFFKPFHDPDFRWLFFTRFLMMMGVGTIGSFVEYWLVEVVDLPESISPERGVAILVMSLIIPGLPTSFVAGIASDQWGNRRKVFVVLGGSLCALTAFAFIFLSDFATILVFMVVAGIGFGIYIALDYALALDVLAESNTFGLDMAVWHQAEVIPRLIATPVAAVILSEFHKLEGCTHDRLNGPQCNKKCTLGWSIVWFVVFLYFTLAGLFVFRIKKAK